MGQEYVRTRRIIFKILCMTSQAVHVARTPGRALDREADVSRNLYC